VQFRKVCRRNIAYGTITQHGTIFVWVSADQRIWQAILETMVGARDCPPERSR